MYCGAWGSGSHVCWVQHEQGRSLQLACPKATAVAPCPAAHASKQQDLQTPARSRWLCRPPSAASAGGAPSTAPPSASRSSAGRHLLTRRVVVRASQLSAVPVALAHS